MLNQSIKKKLESLKQIPTIPFVISQVLNAVDDDNLSASNLATMIEQDQSLTFRVLTVANSPFYGFSRRISTIDLAIVVLGLNTIKEIVLSLAIQKFFSNVTTRLFDLKSFWHYSVFCGAASRVLARKLNYKLVGEAFVAGLMHDIGILILVQFFKEEFKEIKLQIVANKSSLVDAEINVLGSTHCGIGAWLANYWNLPKQLSNAIMLHHSHFDDVVTYINSIVEPGSNEDDEIEQPLTAIVALGEWFAQEMDYKNWAMEEVSSHLYLAEQIVDEIKSHDLLNPTSALELIKQEIIDEYNKAQVLSNLSVKPLYK